MDEYMNVNQIRSADVIFKKNVPTYKEIIFNRKII